MCRFSILSVVLLDVFLRSGAVRKLMDDKVLDGEVVNDTAVGETEWWDRRRRWMGERRRRQHTRWDERLNQGSSAPTMTYYIYRSQGPAGTSTYPFENVNAASLGGVMWYLHNEIIFTCHGAGGILGSRGGGSGIVGERKFNITRILRRKVTMKATQTLIEKNMHFTVLHSYDAGQATGPFRADHKGEGEWNQFGYTVGCGRIGGYPHEDWKSGKTYPDAIWYSFPGPCPSMKYYKETEMCKKQQPGGRCQPGVMPTGEGTCTYQYEDAGEIDINELVGITPKWKNRAEFCTQCKSEGTEHSRGGCGLNFWGNGIWDREANHKQVRLALELFEKKYPGSTKDSGLTAAPCDFDNGRFQD